MLFIILWKVTGVLEKPKYIMVTSKRPCLVINTIFHLSPSLMQTLLYLYLKSILVKIKALLSDSIKLAILEIRQQFLIVIPLRALQSMTGYKLLLYFFTKKNRATIRLVDSWIYPFLSSSLIHMLREFLSTKESKQTLTSLGSVAPSTKLIAQSYSFHIGILSNLFFENIFLYLYSHSST